MSLKIKTLFVATVLAHIFVLGGCQRRLARARKVNLANSLAQDNTFGQANSFNRVSSVKPAPNLNQVQMNGINNFEQVNYNSSGQGAPNTPTTQVQPPLMNDQGNNPKIVENNAQFTPSQVYQVQNVPTPGQTEANKKIIEEQLGEVFNQTYKWARSHYPLSMRMLEISKVAAKERFVQIPIPVFLDIVRNSSNADYDEVRKRFMDKYSNFTIYELAKDVQERSNLTEGENFKAAMNVTQQLIEHPKIKAFVRDAMMTRVNGIPVTVSIASMMKHLGNDVHVKELSDPLIVSEILSNVTDTVQPILEYHVNKTLPALRDYFSEVIQNVTQNEQYQAISEFARNFSHETGELMRKSLLHYLERRYKS